MAKKLFVMMIEGTETINLPLPSEMGEVFGAIQTGEPGREEEEATA